MHFCIAKVKPDATAMALGVMNTCPFLQNFIVSQSSELSSQWWLRGVTRMLLLQFNIRSEVDPLVH